MKPLRLHHDGSRVPVLLGLDDADAWRSKQAHLSLEVYSDQPVDWRITDHGELTCTTSVEEFQEGRHVEVGTGIFGPNPVHASGLASTHEIQRRGVGFLFLQANLAYHAAVIEDGNTTWEAQGEPDGTFEVIEHRLNLTPGPVEVRIPRLSATDSVFVGYLLLDLPAWAADGFVVDPDSL